MDVEDGSSDNISRDQLELNEAFESALIADLRPWGWEKYQDASYYDLTRPPS
ncbi:hypothetical protein BE221DRAFT_192183 [Ostreococcus tauri]|uniref:Uncharacterized protein n=1 Tax=Ostreococcus tauri TaxID=70448 RepID=A0A1Y5I9E5_OSTTA|nr:hypothetical protein BE221DRAFT_192183 [Ostreococcus tauri]